MDICKILGFLVFISQGVGCFSKTQSACQETIISGTVNMNFAPSRLSSCQRCPGSLNETQCCQVTNGTMIQLDLKTKYRITKIYMTCEDSCRYITIDRSNCDVCNKLMVFTISHPYRCSGGQCTIHVSTDSEDTFSNSTVYGQIVGDVITSKINITVCNALKCLGLGIYGCRTGVLQASKTTQSTSKPTIAIAASVSVVVVVAIGTLLVVVYYRFWRTKNKKLQSTEIVSDTEDNYDVINTDNDYMELSDDALAAHSPVYSYADLPKMSSLAKSVLEKSEVEAGTGTVSSSGNNYVDWNYGNLGSYSDQALDGNAAMIDNDVYQGSDDGNQLEDNNGNQADCKSSENAFISEVSETDEIVTEMVDNEAYVVD